MKMLLLKWLANTVVVVGVVVAILFSVSQLNTCSVRNSTAVISNAVSSDLRATIADSTQTSARDANNAWRDSVIATERKKILSAQLDGKVHKRRVDLLNTAIAALQYKTDSLVRAYRNDTAGRSNTGDDAVEALQAENDSLSIEVSELTAENKDLDVESEGYSRALYECGAQRMNDAETINSKKELIGVKDREIAAYKKAQSKGDNFFVKSEKWVFGIAGALATFLAMK